MLAPSTLPPVWLDIPDKGMIKPSMGIMRGGKSLMDKNNPTTATMANALFTGTQQRVLGYLFGQPERSFFANELIGLTGSGSGAVQRELKRLAESGLVNVRKIGNQKHFQANPLAPIYQELCGITQKTFGLAGPLTEALKPIESAIEAAFVYGSVAKGKDTASSDIDLMIISETLSYAEVMQAMEAAQARLGRHINPTLYSRKEIQHRIQEGQSFVSRVLAQPKIWLKGGEAELAA